MPTEAPSFLPAFSQVACYEIVAQGTLDDTWTDWFEPLLITHRLEGSQTVVILRGCVPDQAALHGTLQKLFTLRLPLISVRIVDKNEREGPL